MTTLRNHPSDVFAQKKSTFYSVYKTAL